MIWLLSPLAGSCCAGHDTARCECIDDAILAIWPRHQAKMHAALMAHFDGAASGESLPRGTRLLSLARFRLDATQASHQRDERVGR